MYLVSVIFTTNLRPNDICLRVKNRDFAFNLHFYRPFMWRLLHCDTALVASWSGRDEGKKIIDCCSKSMR